MSAFTDASSALPLIAIKGKLRRSPPADGNAVYVWRMVLAHRGERRRFLQSPAASVVVPEEFKPEAPEDYLTRWLAYVPELLNWEIDDAKRHSPDGTMRGYFQDQWARVGRRQAFIDEILTPIVKDVIFLLSQNGNEEIP